MCSCLRIRCRSIQRYIANAVCQDGGFCKRLLSPKLWAQKVTGPLNRLVNRRAVVLFAAFEFLVSVWLIGFYWMFPRVGAVIDWTGIADIVMELPTMFAFVLLFIRSASSLLGAIAMWQRWVSRTRMYWVLIMINLVLSVPVIIPIWVMGCQCSLDAGGFPTNERQCQALTSYEWLISSEVPSRRLSNTFKSFSWRQQEQKLAELWSLLQQPPATPQQPSSTPLRRLEAASATRQADPSLLGVATTMPLLQRLLDRFVVTDGGFDFDYDREQRLDIHSSCDAHPYVLTGPPARAQTVLLRKVQCGKDISDDDEYARDRLMVALRECLATEFCAGVHLEMSAENASLVFRTCGMRYDGTVPRLSQAALDAARSCSRVTWDCRDSPPPGMTAHCAGFSVHLVRLREEVSIQQIPPVVLSWCTVINAFTMMLILILSAGAFPMLIVIFKYFSQHCGDAFEMGPQQFPVMESNVSHDSDQFDVGTWISLQPNQAGGNSMTSGLSGATAATSRSLRTPKAGAASVNQLETLDESFVSYDFSVHSGDFSPRATEEQGSVMQAAESSMTSVDFNPHPQPAKPGNVELKRVSEPYPLDDR